MKQDAAEALERVNALVNEYRDLCLWFVREDYYPQTPEEACRALESIEKHGDVAAFRKAADLRQWFLRNSSGPSAA